MELVYLSFLVSSLFCHLNTSKNSNCSHSHHPYPVGLAYCEIYITKSSALAYPLLLLLIMVIGKGELSRRDPHLFSFLYFNLLQDLSARKSCSFPFFSFRSIVRRNSGSGSSSRFLAILRSSAAAYYICRRPCGSMWPRYGSWKSRCILS